MARFVALLLIGPWLLVLGWLYWLYVRRRVANGVSVRFDVGVLAIAALATIASTAFGYQAALGHGGPIWKQVAAALGAYAGFNVVVLFGLLRHWLARGHMTSAPRGS
ncbi:MAG TPA: hypothetical protein VFK00_00795 [Rhodanobacteraceae bacterium]|jgi:hypothetical protein|nr:hypothetical protein [Rhodanobacteraceae bacterium]